ncbi:F-box domain-containing protein [Podospora appendiculata]|uniref:F-box domain-containing protein n=1 Tax=Podospora appendiculata TaxID=314037 RepID=A0AAE0XLD4_9PEZI|nr:F-box domain-containing protein [Podospora appendiculata]
MSSLARTHGSGYSLASLSTELLAMIFEDLQEIDPRALFVARRLSKRFNQIATPVCYRTVHINSRIASRDAEQRYPGAFRLIFAYTRHVLVTSNLDYQCVRYILDNIQKLQSIRYSLESPLQLSVCYVPDICSPHRRWRYFDTAFPAGDFWVPSSLPSLKKPYQEGPRLYVEDLPLTSMGGSLSDIYLKAIPCNLLVSLKMISPTPPLTTRLHSLKRLLLEARYLETLQYRDLGQGTQFAFSAAERFPPFRSLSLTSYNWTHTREEVATHWDFSRICSLELVSVPLFNFLASISFPDFAQLQDLNLEDFSAHTMTDCREEATWMLYVLLKDYIRSLRTLRITCHTTLFPIDALLAHSRSLEALHFRDHVGFSEDDRYCPTMPLGDLMVLSQVMVVLNTLELDMHITNPDCYMFLLGLCNFPQLHTLVVHMQTLLDCHRVYLPEEDPDKDSAMRMFEFLLRNKTGHRAWRRIVINVGGWKRVMIPRLGEPWREQNKRGKFAERSFVLERSSAGEFMAWEEPNAELEAYQGQGPLHHGTMAVQAEVPAVPS